MYSVIFIVKIVKTILKYNNASAFGNMEIIKEQRRLSN